MKMCFTYKFVFMQIKLISYEKFCTKTRFEAEANQNSDMGYFLTLKVLKNYDPIQVTLWKMLEKMTSL